MRKLYTLLSLMLILVSFIEAQISQGGERSGISCLVDERFNEEVGLCEPLGCDSPLHIYHMHTGRCDSRSACPSIYRLEDGRELCLQNCPLNQVYSIALRRCAGLAELLPYGRVYWDAAAGGRFVGGPAGSIVCPSGQTTFQWQGDVSVPGRQICHPICRRGVAFNFTTRRCDPGICQNGQTYNPASETCEAPPSTSQVRRVCNAVDATLVEGSRRSQLCQCNYQDPEHMVRSINFTLDNGDETAAGSCRAAAEIRLRKIQIDCQNTGNRHDPRFIEGRADGSGGCICPTGSEVFSAPSDGGRWRFPSCRILDHAEAINMSTIPPQSAPRPPQDTPSRGAAAPAQTR